jgi:hypothetical protein
MKKRTLTLAALGLAVLAAAATQEITLKRTLQPNTKDVYSVTMSTKNKMSMGAMGMGEQAMTIDGTMKITMSTGAVEGGKADVELKTTDMKYKFGGAAAGAAGAMGSAPKELVVKGKLDEKNRFTDMKAPTADAQMAMMMSNNMQSFGQSIEFPDKPVKVGDSWEVVMPKNELAGMEEAKMTATLFDDRADGHCISLTGVIPMKMDMAEMMKKNPDIGATTPMPNMMITGLIDVKMLGLFDKASGKTLRMTTRMNQKMKIDIKDQNMAFEGGGQTVMLMSLLGP